MEEIRVFLVMINTCTKNHGNLERSCISDVSVLQKVTLKITKADFYRSPRLGLS